MNFEIETQEAKRPVAPAIIALPQPAQRGGLPVMEALKRRHSSREFSRKELPEAVLSNLLWAAFGINRPQTHGRTAPSAHDWEEINVYVATAKGLYLYDAERHALKQVLPQDLRAQTGIQFNGGVRSYYDVDVISVYDDQLAQKRYEQVNATFRREIESVYEELKKKY
jgi:ligand-binding sensor domain-containing protein